MIFEEKTITIQTMFGPENVPAHVASNGLAYHHTSVNPNIPPDQLYPDLANHWTVTHVESGYTINPWTYTFASAQQAEKFIGCVGRMVDWHAAKPKVNRRMKHFTRDLAQDIQGCVDVVVEITVL